MNKFQLDIITPIRIDSHNNVSYLRIPALDGLTGIKARHAAAIIALKIGEVKVVIDGKEKYFSTSGGFVDIKHESVQLLLETIESKETIDQKRAQEALERAEKRIKDKSMDFGRAQKALMKSINRLKLIKK